MLMWPIGVASGNSTVDVVAGTRSRPGVLSALRLVASRMTRQIGMPHAFVRARSLSCSPAPAVPRSLSSLAIVAMPASSPRTASWAQLTAHAIAPAGGAPTQPAGGARAVKPDTFTTLEALQTAMRAEARNVRDFASNRCTSLASIVTTSVAPNTFRAFPLRRLGHHPSKVYRDWTTSWVTSEWPRFSTITTPEMMRTWMVESARALESHWNRITGNEQPIGVGRAAKLLALTAKHLLWHASLSNQDRARLLSFLDVPLDKYTLQGIRLLLPEARIPRSASMGFVRTMEQYHSIQNGIRALASQLSTPDAPLSPIHYEVAAWNAAHPTVPAVQPRCNACTVGSACYR